MTLDTVISAFNADATAEEIVQQYPSIALADVYSVIAYYLRHQADARRISLSVSSRPQRSARRWNDGSIHLAFGNGSSHVADSWSRPFCGSPPTRTSTTM